MTREEKIEKEVYRVSNNGDETREEEIEKEAYRVSNNGDKYTSFIQGAKWADSNPQENLIDIEKACNWLKDRISIPYEGNYNENGEPFAGDYIKFAMERLKRAEEFCKEFKNAMKQ